MANGSRFNATMYREVKDGLQQKPRRDVDPEGDTSQLVYLGFGANIRDAISRK